MDNSDADLYRAWVFVCNVAEFEMISFSWQARAERAYAEKNRQDEIARAERRKRIMQCKIDYLQGAHPGSTVVFSHIMNCFCIIDGNANQYVEDFDLFPIPNAFRRKR